MATQYEPIVKDSTLNTTEQTPRNLADVLASGLTNIANNVKPDGSDISISVPGMTANNVNDGFSELKGTLDDVIATLITHSATQYLIGTLKFKGIYNDATVKLQIGKLDNNTNYVQFFVNDVDYGYIRFDVSRNIGVIN